MANFRASQKLSTILCESSTSNFCLIIDIRSAFRVGVRVGEHNILTPEDCQIQLDGSNKCNGPVQDLSIEQIIIHPQYNTTALVNDIGLVRVSKIDLSVGK